MASKETGFHPLDPDWTRGRAIAVTDADALARRQISMTRPMTIRAALQPKETDHE